MMGALTAALRRIGTAVATGLDQWFGWHRLPEWLALVVLVGIRSRLRAENLHHTSLGRPPALPGPPLPACRRSPDGSFNDLGYPTMGAAGTPFGRNVPLTAVSPETPGLPNPLRVSSELLARREFRAADPLNMLAAAWVQFMIHDWFSHGPTGDPDAPGAVKIPPADDHPEPARKPVRVARTAADPTRPACSGACPTFVNHVTHWWDASQLYGSDQATLDRVRGGTEGEPDRAPAGKIRTVKDGGSELLPLDMTRPEPERTEVSGFTDNWWIGLSLLHTLFALEHNRLCEALRGAHPDWSDEDLFAHARLINAAVLAKIHTLEWTPAILDNPAVQRGLRASWRGLKHEGGIYRILSWFAGREIREGIRGTPTDHHGVPYSITEEFVSVYRMHTLLPDALDFRSLKDPDHPIRLDLPDVLFGSARRVLTGHGLSMADVAYSFGRQGAGAITLHNYPNALRDLKLPTGIGLDLAAVDILRDRERGIPRYNAFRRLLHMRAVTSFERLVGREGRDRGWHEELRAVYGDVEQVDLMVGLFAEPKPKGFGFSDTAFRIFTFMAGRRLQSDRFFTSDYTREVYSPEGWDWVEEADMKTILLRHFPDLRDRVAPLRNVFHRWDAR